jgi:hypothetical protein
MASRCRAYLLVKGIIRLSLEYAAVNDVFSGNKFTKANSFGLKKTLSFEIVFLIV